MTIKQYISKLDKMQKSVESLSEKALADASFATFDLMSKRIFDEGKNVIGSTFQYSKKPAIIAGYKIRVPKNVNEKSKVYRFYKFKRAKNGVKGYWGRYFPLGYWEYKKFIGRKNDFVNFKLTGGLQMAFNNGFKKVSPNEFEVRLRNTRAVGLKTKLDEKYGNVFRISDNENDFFRDKYSFGIKYYMNL